MSFALTSHSLVGPVAETLAREVNGMPAKEAARLLGTSLPTITRIRRGEMPSAGVLLAAIKFFGVRILEPVIGKFDDASLVRRLDAIEGLLKEVRHARSQPAASASSADRDMGAAGRACDGDRRLHLGSVRPDGAGVLQESPPASLALVQVRRPLDIIDGGRAGEERGHLASHLRRWRDSLGRADRVSLVQVARETPHLRTSLVTPHGDDLLYRHISPAFRLHALDRERLIGRPTTESFDQDYARACAANTHAVIAAGEPARVTRRSSAPATRHPTRNPPPSTQQRTRSASRREGDRPCRSASRSSSPSRPGSRASAPSPGRPSGSAGEWGGAAEGRALAGGRRGRRRSRSCR